MADKVEKEVADVDVTDQVEFDLNDDELLPLRKCVCGAKFEPWDFIVGIYADMPQRCSKCGRRFYFAITIRVFEVQG